MDQGGCVQGTLMVVQQLPYRFQDKVHFKGIAELMRKHLHGTGIQYDGKVAEGSADPYVGYVRQQDLAGTEGLKLTVHEVGRHGVCP